MSVNLDAPKASMITPAESAEVFGEPEYLLASIQMMETGYNGAVYSPKLGNKNNFSAQLLGRWSLAIIGRTKVQVRRLLNGDFLLLQCLNLKKKLKKKI